MYEASDPRPAHCLPGRRGRNVLLTRREFFEHHQLLILVAFLGFVVSVRAGCLLVPRLDSVCLFRVFVSPTISTTAHAMYVVYPFFSARWVGFSELRGHRSY
jgi:hypothetical protein